MRRRPWINECMHLQLDQLKEKFLFRAFFLRHPNLAYLLLYYFPRFIRGSLSPSPVSFLGAFSPDSALMLSVGSTDVPDIYNQR